MQTHFFSDQVGRNFDIHVYNQRGQRMRVERLRIVCRAIDYLYAWMSRDGNVGTRNLLRWVQFSDSVIYKLWVIMNCCIRT